MPTPKRPFFRILRWLCAAGIVTAICLLLWGGTLLIITDPPPAHVNAAVVLQGSIAAEKTRIAGAIRLLQQGVADRALLSVPKESYWGQSVPPAARAYLERNYGADLASRVDFCETSAEVNSTVQEAQALGSCIQAHDWHSIVIVTSDYHTRRARLLWKRATANNSNIRIWVEGVADPEFQQPWWRHRQSAKVWLMEFSKLIWVELGG